MSREFFGKIFLIKTIFIVLVIILGLSKITFAEQIETLSNVIDCGAHGHVFEIKEVSLLAEIMDKLLAAQEDGKLEDLNKQFVDKARKKILRPTPVSNIVKAKTNRSWTYNPVFTQSTDIKDDQGQIIIKGGTKVNPLDKFSWGEPLIFIDGDDQEQVDWAKDKIAKIVLISGAPFDLGNELKRPVYFDQGGILCRKFKIEAVPAIIEQQDKMLIVREVAL
jgi:conjugal transfer pilus assembly protein TraW